MNLTNHSITPSPFYFIRHGETDWNKSAMFLGSKDIPLNETGITQAQTAAQHLYSFGIKTIVSSPLQRALKTAEIIAHQTKCSATIIDEFKECSLGIREGQFKSNFSSFSCSEWKSGNYTIEQVEPYEQFIARVKTGLSKALALPGPVLIVAHNGVYVGIQEILCLTHQRLDNCSIIAHTPHETGWQVSNLSHRPPYDDIG